MTTLERFFFPLLYTLMFVLAVAVSVKVIGQLNENEQIVTADMVDKASVSEHIGAEKSSLGIEAEYDATTGDAKYVTVKGSDVIFDLVTAIDSVSVKDIENGKISVKIKSQTGIFIIPTNAELKNIKNRKSSTLNGLDSKINKQKDYRRIYYYDTDLSIAKLVYEY